MIKKHLTVTALIIFIFIAVSACLTLNINVSSAAAETALAARQTATVYYCGKNYVDGNGNFIDLGEGAEKNALFTSVEFLFAEEKISVKPENVKLSGSAIKESGIKEPGVYNLTAEVTVSGAQQVKYVADLQLTVSKAPLYVRTKINGESYCVVNEGEEYRTTIEYSGFVNGETVADLDAPALIQREPKMPTTGYLLVPELASSSRYEIIYEGATIVINANPDFERIYVNGNETALILRGSFSPYYSLEFYDVGLNKSDSRYVAINEKVEKYFGGNRVFEEYSQANAYVINMYLDGEYADLSGNVNVRIKIPSRLTGKSSYRIMHFSTDGEYEFINATEIEGGYISFVTADLGEFVLLTPIEGASRTTIIAICVCAVVVVILCVLLVAVFRRKY